MRRTRPNPIVFDNRIPLTPELRESIRVARSRVVASALSPAKHRAIEVATANSPHNFRVVVEPRYRTRDNDLWRANRDLWLANRERFWRDVVRPNAVTLVSEWDEQDLRAEGEQPFNRREKAQQGGIYTAFTYLHRLGDHIATWLFLPWVFNKDSLLSTLARGYSPDDTDALEVAAQRADVARVVEMARENNALLHRTAADIERYDPSGSYTLMRYVETHVNSKMVREGYSSDINQSLSDLFPLCELTPPSRPLFLPFDEASMAMAHPRPYRDWDKAYPAEVAEACSAYGEEMNVRFRDLYNTLIPALYGTVWFI
jgi:hypothetical protein